jgi:hypothetical protein
MKATVHWLRHTGISDDVKHRPREHVHDDAGHGSGAITDRYIDVNLQNVIIPLNIRSFKTNMKSYDIFLPLMREQPTFVELKS